MEPLEKMKHGKKWITSVLYDSVCITVMCMNDARLSKYRINTQKHTHICNKSVSGSSNQFAR